MTYHNYGNRLLELSELEDDLKKRVELIESSIKKYEEAISLDPLFKYSYNGIGNCYYKLAMLDKEKRRHFLEKAIEYYEKAIALDNEYSTPKKNIEICKVLLKKI
jgi:tetratricopeptide (TPR) repeat protein